MEILLLAGKAKVTCEAYHVYSTERTSDTKIETRCEELGVGRFVFASNIEVVGIYEYGHFMVFAITSGTARITVNHA